MLKLIELHAKRNRGILVYGFLNKIIIIIINLNDKKQIKVVRSWY